MDIRELFTPIYEQQEELPSEAMHFKGKFPYWALRGENRRFMVNPRTGDIVIGMRDAASGSSLTSSHAREFADSGAPGNFDDYYRGWVGIGGRYKYGVIHFAPPVTQGWIDSDRTAYPGAQRVLKIFQASGATPTTKVRGVITMNDTPMKEFL